MAAFAVAAAVFWRIDGRVWLRHHRDGARGVFLKVRVGRTRLVGAAAVVVGIGLFSLA